MRDYEEILKKLENNLDYATECKKAWESVTINKKKNGDDFECRTKSYGNARWGSAQNAIHPELIVSFRTRANGYTYESLQGYIYADELKKDDPRYATATSYIRPTIVLTPDEMKERINARIKKLSAEIESLKKQIEISRALFERFNETIQTALEEVKKECAGLRVDKNASGQYIYPTSLEYALREYMERGYFSL